MTFNNITNKMSTNSTSETIKLGKELTNNLCSSDKILSFTENKPFICTYDNCSKTFSKYSKLLYHLRRHTGERPFACDEPNCNKAYFHSFHLRRHKDRHISKYKSEDLICPVEDCFAVLANEDTLKKHMKRKHNPEKIYKFTYFECSTCSMKFRILRDLNRHKRTHTQYFCNCGEKYERWNALLAHKRECIIAWHECPVCERKFKLKTNLNTHMNTHVVRENKFTCGYQGCGRSYLYKKNLMQHIKSYHQKIVRKILCPMYGKKCFQVFSKNQSVENHMRRFHSDDSQNEGKLVK